MRERYVLGNKPGGVDQDPLIVALAPLLLAGDEFVDLGVQPVTRKQSKLDCVLEFALEHVKLPAVDYDLIHLDPSGRVELAPRQRDEGAAGLEPLLAADDLGRSCAADGYVRAAHDLLDRVLR